MGLLLLIYVLGFFVTVLLDAFVGIGIDGETTPPIFVVAIVWPLLLCVMLFLLPIEALADVKKKRITRQAKKSMLRVEQEQNEQEVLRQIEEELRQERKVTR